MTADGLIRSMLALAAKWFEETGNAFDGDTRNAVAATASASASSLGLAVAMSWVAREYPDRADEVARIVEHYIANGGDDHGLTAAYEHREVPA